VSKREPTTEELLDRRDFCLKIWTEIFKNFVDRNFCCEFFGRFCDDFLSIEKKIKEYFFLATEKKFFLGS